MKNIKKEIKNSLDGRNLTNRWLAKEIKMSEQNLGRILEGKSKIKAICLEDIAKILNIPIINFFDEDVIIANNKYNIEIESLKTEIFKLKELIEDKKTIITLQEKLIQKYETRL